MPSRMLRDWSDSYAMDGISPAAESLFVRLIMKADDYGNFHADDRIVLSICYPLGTNINIQHALLELADRKLINFYKNNDRLYLSIMKFGQRLRHTNRKFPDPAAEFSYTPDVLSLFSDVSVQNSAAPMPQDSDNPPQSAADCRNLPPEVEEKRSEVEVEEKRKDRKPSPAAQVIYSEEFQSFWNAYPCKVSKLAAFREWEKAMPDINICLKAVSDQIAWRENATKDEFRPPWKHPERWIKYACWHNEVETPQQEDESWTFIN